MIKIFYRLSLFIFCSLLFSSCFDDTEETNYKKYEDWRNENVKYIKDLESEIIDGQPRFKKIVPAWDKSVYTLMEWHKRNEESKSGLYPISTSIVDVKYVLRNIDGDTIDSSSFYRCRPNSNVTGFWVALTNMLPGDSVTAVIPFEAGYGVYGSKNILPYSTLIFDIKLVSIVAYESLPWR